MTSVLPSISSSREPGERVEAGLLVRGAVQGVGFRPFVYRLAIELGLAGEVLNAPDGVRIQLQGPRPVIENFVARLQAERPPAALIRQVELRFTAAQRTREGFAIVASDGRGRRSALILPDLAPCADCRREICDPAERRYRYPFTNCTHCGPRFSLIEALPYDRDNTTMRRFRMCTACRCEYDDPADRRFHAQPIACPDCGPRLAAVDGRGTLVAVGDPALTWAGEVVRRGGIVALKGVGGFQLIVDARDDAAVVRLRERKLRPEKPFAVMFGDLAALRREVAVNEQEETLLGSMAAPIVLLRRRVGGQLASSVAPSNPLVGAMLPSSPLHQLLLSDLDFPVVATSGNRSDEPICIDNEEAMHRLRGLADFFLVHDRPVVRPIDDSVMRVVAGRAQVLRRARGLAPLPVALPVAVPTTIAAGAQQKNCVALGLGREAFVGPHVGDLGSAEAAAAFDRALSDLPRIYGAEIERAVCDAHPDYFSTQEIRRRFPAAQAVQHHHAHVLAVMAEHGIAGPVLGVCWDGTGLGADGTLWGGEFLIARRNGFERFGHFRPFPLPGGEVAAREPRRSALGVRFALHGDDCFRAEAWPDGIPFTPAEQGILRRALHARVNCPPSSSAGRLFDAAASLAGLRQRASFEGQAAMDLEFAAADGDAAAYPFELRVADGLVYDWEPTLTALQDDRRAGVPVPVIAARFHRTLVEVIVAVAHAAGLRDVVLTGGCFQNTLLLTIAIRRLESEGFAAHWPEQIPPNDGGIALGQVWALPPAGDFPSPNPQPLAPIRV
jgi:hydrogenase maturation protein HypF